MKQWNNLKVWTIELILSVIHANYKHPRTLLKVWAVLAATFVALTIAGVFNVSPPPTVPLEDAASASRLTPLAFEMLLERSPQAIQIVVIYPGVDDIIVYRVLGKTTVGPPAEPAPKLSDPDPGMGAEVPVITPQQEAPPADSDARVYLIRYQDKTKLESALAARHIRWQVSKPYVATDFTSMHRAWWVVVATILGVSLLILLILTITRRSGTLAYAGSDAGGGAAEIDERAVTFDQIGGCDEAVARIKRIAYWLRYKKWYDLFHAELPKGALLMGPPGTGKTELARALRTEADANLFIVSGSEFIEKYVGVGASRVRDLYEQAKSKHKQTGKLSIVFIDEIDAIGSSRKGGSNEGDSEHNRTINQLLTCMNGADSADGIFWIGASNLHNILDPALTRPGRLEYHIRLALPDQPGRLQIFKIHTRKLSLSEDVDLKQLAKRTPGFSGATIKKVCNEAAISAAERTLKLAESESIPEEEHELMPRLISIVDFDKAIDEAQFGDRLSSREGSQTRNEQVVIAVHEACHAVALAAMSKGKYLPTKVSREMRSESLGLMQSHTDGDKYTYDKAYFKANIVSAFAGHLGQILFIGPDSVDTGASSDFQQANKLIRLMIGQCGMSGLGAISIPLDELGFPKANVSNEFLNKFDAEWQRMKDEYFNMTKTVLKENADAVKRVAAAVLEDEYILTERFLKLWKGEEQIDIPEELKAVNP